MIKAKTYKEVWAMSGKGYLYSHVFKPITTVCRQVPMRGIACTIEGVEMLISMTMVGRAEVMLIKTMETWRIGGWVSKLWSLTLIGKGVVQTRV